MIRFRVILPAALLLMTIAAPIAAADVCLDDTCAGIHIQGVDFKGCKPSADFISTVHPWYYNIGIVVRDPAVNSLYYSAFWVKHTEYGVNCAVTSWSCDIYVSDGSHFSSAHSGSTTVVAGEYKGLLVTGGTVTCGTTTASIDTYIEGVVELKGRTA